jgi:hypothetical protein
MMASHPLGVLASAIRHYWTWPLRMRGALVDDVDDAMLVRLYSHATIVEIAYPVPPVELIG